MISQLTYLAEQSHRQQVRLATERSFDQHVADRPSFDQHVAGRPTLLPLFAAALARRYPSGPISTVSAPRITTV